MYDDRFQDIGDIVGYHEIPAPDDGVCFGKLQKRQGPSGREPVLKKPVFSRYPDDLLDKVEYLLTDMDVPAKVQEFQYRRFVKGLKRMQTPLLALPEYLPLGFAVGIPQRDGTDEAVKLRAGHPEDTRLLEGVLRRDDEEGIGQRVCPVLDADLALRHALQQRGLGSGRGPVDLVRQQDTRHDRARMEFELAGLEIEDIQACFLFATKFLKNTDFMPLMEESV